MLGWLYAHAPIRQKFDVLNACQATIQAVVVAVAALAPSDARSMLAASIMGLIATVAIGLAARRIICTPYVITVERMEALAAGDLESPVRFTDHTDCVGRLTKAMARFSRNTERVAQSEREMGIIVQELSTALARLESGDLRYRIETSFGAAQEALRATYNRTMDELAATLDRVAGSASHVHTGSAEIRAASDDLSQRTEQQAASLQETTVAMKQVTAQVIEAARGANAVNALVSEAHGEASEGGQVVGRAIDAMGQIEKSASEISQIIAVIDGIAFQTNLLALNAGVEAARAGDAGKGFAVVANEVRALAQRSAEAAKDIKELIGASTEQVTGGVALVRQTGVRLDQIVSRVAEISDAIQAIAQSAESQASGLEQVQAAVVDMDKVTQQNAAMVEQSTAAARSLAGEADALTELVARFRTGTAPRRIETSTAPTLLRQPPAPRERKPAPIRGNLAVQEQSDDQDWTEF